MKTWTTRALAMCAALLIAGPAAAKSDDDPALTELVQILRKQGVIEEEQYQALALKAAKQEKKRSWTDRISMWGDFRARYESFFFYDDPINGNASRPDRHRYRYRLRLNVKGEVNDYANVYIRLATGKDPRTTNQTLGDGFDFDTNEIFLDQAYVKVSPFAHGAIPEADGDLWLAFGKTNQPWRWDHIFKDWLLWDDEISPSGFYADSNLKLTDQLGLYANGGVYVIDENSTSKDPMMNHIQIGLDGDLDERFDVGGRFTWFNMWDLDGNFIQRGVDSTMAPSAVTFAAGNIAGGLTGHPNGGSASVVEFGAYAKANLIDRWPIVFVFDFARNLDASKTPTTSEQGNAWMAAVAVGDTKEIVRFRMHYAWLEANSFPAQFVDSDLFDQFTNRKGWVWDLSKRIFTNTDASFTAFLSDPIKTNLAYTNSLGGSRRLRMQANLVWSF